MMDLSSLYIAECGEQKVYKQQLVPISNKLAWKTRSTLHIYWSPGSADCIISLFLKSPMHLDDKRSTHEQSEHMVMPSFVEIQMPLEKSQTAYIVSKYMYLLYNICITL